MFPECPEHCNAKVTLSEYSRNIACRLGTTDTSPMAIFTISSETCLGIFKWFASVY